MIPYLTFHLKSNYLATDSVPVLGDALVKISEVTTPPNTKADLCHVS